MPYYYPFGEEVHPLRQIDMSPKKVFVLGVYASAVHARWIRDGHVRCQAMAVASEPRIFWDGNPEEAEKIIGRIRIPPEAGILEPTSAHLNGPSAKALDDHILAPLGFTRDDAWLCDCLPETRLNERQLRAISERYTPLANELGLNEVTIPPEPDVFCTPERAVEITGEIMKSEAGLLILLGDIPISQYLKRVADIGYSTLGRYTKLYGYGTVTDCVIEGRKIGVLPLAHPRHIGGLGSHSERWRSIHAEWEAGLVGKNGNK